MIHDICVEIRKALEEEEDLEKVVTQAFLNLDRALHRHLSNYGNSEDNTHTPQLILQTVSHLHTHGPALFPFL
jgi:hypothetical protein